MSGDLGLQSVFHKSGHGSLSHHYIIFVFHKQSFIDRYANFKAISTIVYCISNPQLCDQA